MIYRDHRLKLLRNGENGKGIRDYAEEKGLDNTRKKTLQLLHNAGMEVQDIFEDIADPDPCS